MLNHQIHLEKTLAISKPRIEPESINVFLYPTPDSMIKLIRQHNNIKE